MKKNLSSITLIIFSNIIFSQNILFDNHTFELGNFKTSCDYNGSVFYIDNYISSWRVAKHKINMGNGISPFWLDISKSVCNNYRFVCDANYISQVNFLFEKGFAVGLKFQTSIKIIL